MGLLAALWGVSGVAGVLAFAVYRLTPIAFEAIMSELTAIQWTVLVVNTLFMAWSEGYRGFQLKFCPRVAARALYLCRNPSLRDAVLAPLFVVGFFRSERRTMIVAWAGTFGIIALVILVHQLNQPWRGIIDAGVVLGLSWGLVTFVTMVFKTFRDGRYYHCPEVPGTSVEVAHTA